jgi:hypothetical protein
MWPYYLFVLSLLVLLFMGILYYSMYIFILFYVILGYSIILYYSMYCLCVYVYKPLPPGVYPIAVDKYINININQYQYQYQNINF